MKHKNIMVVGTSSGAGKSITVTALCHIFNEDGYKVAPFKSQNMALNSFITKDGKEMGRAQVVQAFAAGIEPKAYMNPILLKPTTQKKIQVIVNGKSIGNMGGIEYGNFKVNLKKEIMNSYNYIKENFDISVIEGAGSPVEINIKEEDIANMGMAEMADAPVILVADIDKGGVFASIYGTIMLMKESERKRVKGVIINKFRGDINILKKGLKEIESLTGVPIIGVMPYSRIDIEEEDSVTERFKNSDSENKGINVGVIKLKHISNFTDIDALSIAKDVNIKYVISATELKNLDIIIIPGSKNTIEDLKDIKENGIATEIIKQSREGKIIIGICGGFQMLGTSIKDPYGIESDIKELAGISLLDLETVMEKEKNTLQYVGKLTNCSGILEGLSGEIVKGYEIHQGVTVGNELKIVEDERIVGVMKDNIIATYLHGIFDNEKVTRTILNKVREKKGLNLQKKGITFEEYKEQEIKKLSNIFRENVDIEKIYEILENK